MLEALRESPFVKYAFLENSYLFLHMLLGVIIGKVSAMFGYEGEQGYIALCVAFGVEVAIDLLEWFFLTLSD